MPLNERFEGCIVGLAVGDALGYPAEFRTRDQILEAFGPEGLDDFVATKDPRWPEKPFIVGAEHPPGTYSDDTQMSLAVARALIEAGDTDLDAWMHAVGRQFVEWSRSPENNRSPGNTCMTGCQNYAESEDWRHSGVDESKGCGSAMRVAPIGLYFHDDLDRVAEYARASSVITHGHDAGVEAAAAAALAVALAVRGEGPETMYDVVMEECAPGSEDFRACLETLPDYLDVEPAVALSDEGLGESWVGEEAVASALYCVWRSPDDYTETVRTAANTDGDSDSIACIAGGISGAYNGVDAIRPRWREEVENADMLTRTAERLLEATPT